MLLIEKLNIIVSSEIELHTFRTTEQEILNLMDFLPIRSAR